MPDRASARQATNGPRPIVEDQVPPDGGAGLGYAGVGAEIDLLVLHRPPEPPEVDVVSPGQPESSGRPHGAHDMKHFVIMPSLGPAVQPSTSYTPATIPGYVER